MKRALSIAGTDPSGGAGTAADMKTFIAHGVYAMSVITSVVAQNTFHVKTSMEVPPDMIAAQIDAVFEDLPPQAVKVGMLSGKESMLAVTDGLRRWKAEHVVIDPVMHAKDGSALMAAEALDTLKSVVIPMAELLTPNIPEAEILSGMRIESEADMERAAEKIRALGCPAVLVKGGHAAGDAVDILFDGKEYLRFCGERIATTNTHGTGCTYSSAIAANLSLGLTLSAAVGRAKDYMKMAIGHSLDIGKGSGPTNHFYELYRHGLTR